MFIPGKANGLPGVNLEKTSNFPVRIVLADGIAPVGSGQL